MRKKSSAPNKSNEVNMLSAKYFPQEVEKDPTTASPSAKEGPDDITNKLPLHLHSFLVLLPKALTFSMLI